ncbi:MAG: hypothetical protein R3283_04520 [Balneolaceae bacterium]|nr:hypothetical protein [Balneolaceae bacterium]
MEQHKVKTYLLYAIGEVLLVVIGILIALQVNNWNENQKERDFEHKILTEIHSTLITEWERREQDFEGYARAKESIGYLTLVRNGEITEPDSLMHHIRRINIRQFFISNSGAYETLKTSGLDKISNENLRRQLVAYHEEYLPATSMMINSVLRNSITENIDLYDRLFVNGVQLNDEGELVDTHPHLSRSDLESEDFLAFLRNANAIQEQFTIFLRATQGRADQLLELIENEIGFDSIEES